MVEKRRRRIGFQFTPVESKLLTLGLNEAAAAGEIEACGIKLLACLRKRGVRPDQILESFGALARLPIDYGAVIMPFGRHSGEPIREIAAIDPDYLSWFEQNCKKSAPKTCDAIARWLAGHDHRESRTG